MPSPLPPIFYHFFRSPLPYAQTLALQNYIHNVQLSLRRSSSSSNSHKDYLLLLEHRPVFTAGRRQREDDEFVRNEGGRLRKMGADFETTQRGGELTYHGPGQLVGYPLLDLGRTSPAISIREYICILQRTLQSHLLTSHGIQYIPSEHTGVFLEDGKTKVASIGVQVRHRLTTHGFAMNVTREPLTWFEEIVACGLADVKAGSIAGRSRTVRDEEKVIVKDQVPGIAETFGRLMQRDMVQLDLDSQYGVEDREIVQAIVKLEREAEVLNRERPPHPRPLNLT